MFKSFLRRRQVHQEARDQAQHLYRFIVTLARTPTFYEEFGVPDTVDGRFELLAMHAFFVMHSLKGGGKPAAVLSQALFDIMFADMDQSLREMGVGDLGVPKHIKRMAKGFYGRAVAYEKALEAGNDKVLKEALRRNLYGTVPDISADRVEMMSRYVARKHAWFGQLPLDEVCRMGQDTPMAEKEAFDERHAA